MFGPHFLIVTNAILEVGVFLMIVIGYATNQWATYTYSCGCDDHCFVFIGPYRAKYTENGKCGYDTEDTDCDDLDLNGDDCDQYKTVRQAGNLALALAVLIFVFKTTVTVLSFLYMGTRRKTLWILMVIHLIADVILGLCAFIAAGQFDEVKEEFKVYVYGDRVDFDNGYGWQLFIGGGFVAWVCAILTAVTLYRGLAPKEDPQPAQEENTK